jgi:serine protease Do
MSHIKTVLAATAFVVAIPAIAQSQFDPLPAGTQTRPVQLTRLVAKLKRGEKVGHFKVGVVCWMGEDISWKSGGRKELSTEEFDDVFREELGKLGYKVAGDPANLFADANDNSAEYLVGGTIDKLNVDLCYPMAGFGNFDKSKGTASIEVEWQIYSRLQRQVVARIPTSGQFTERKSATGGMYIVLMNAFADSVQKLADSKQFRDIFVGAPTDLTVAHTAPSELTAIPISFPKTGPSALSDAVGSTVLIFSGEGHGSGFLISLDGYLLTDNHVVGGAKYVKVRWSDGIETLGEVVRTDKARDVALVKTDSRGRAPLKLRTTQATVGEDVYAIGAPLDVKLQSSVSKGIVSANRVIDGFSYVQSDVSVNPGNSGGPLLDANRNVVGITVAGVAKQGVPLGINLFIPTEDAVDFLALKATP